MAFEKVFNFSAKELHKTDSWDNLGLKAVQSRAIPRQDLMASFIKKVFFAHF